jgi:dihydrofolate reductase
MRKVILSVNVTLDGFMAGPNGELDWHFSHWNDKMGEYVFEQLSAMDTILTGRVTYENMSRHWPTAALNPVCSERDIEFAGMMNNLPKIVFSRTLSAVGWKNTRLVKDDIAGEIARLKQLPGRDMIIWGGAGIMSSFMQLDLVDEYRIWVSPVILGSGIPFFSNTASAPRRNLRLLITKTFTNGVILHCYKPLSRRSAADLPGSRHQGSVHTPPHPRPSTPPTGRFCGFRP